MLLTASITCAWAAALLDRATSSFRLLESWASFSFMAFSPVLSCSTTVVWDAIWGSAWRASFSA
jgi:hypothetical protein